MLEYHYDSEKAQQLPEKIAVEYHLVGEESKLGTLVSTYLNDTVSKILLAKNIALLDSSKQTTGEIVEDNYTSDDKDTLDENYLGNLVVKNEKGEIITSADEMKQWVQDNFYFCLEDQNSPNAWIIARYDDNKQKSVIAVTSKMIEMAENDAQFEGVVAHELGHYFVQKRYGDERAKKATALNEKLADMHALDCLVYMGKNPEEYGIMFQKLNNMYGIDDPIEKLIIATFDEHGGETSRVQDIADYIEATHGHYLEEYYKKEEQKLSEISSPQTGDDHLFNRFKQQFKQLYDSGRYLSSLESEFLKDAKFADAVNQQTGRIDFTEIKYEDALDKLTEIAKFENLRYKQDLKDAAQILQQSSKKELIITPELESKATLFMTVATDSLYMNQSQQASQDSDDRHQKKTKQHIAKVIDTLKQGKDLPNTIENEIIAEEFRRSGIELTPKEVGERLKQLPSSESFSYNGKDVVRSSMTYAFEQYSRTDREKESDFKQPISIHFHHKGIIERNHADTLVDAIVLETYKRDGTILTAKEVAFKLDETLKGLDNVWEENKRINYEGRDVFISPYQSKKYLQIYCPYSSLLSNQDRLNRADLLWADESNHPVILNALDNVLMAVSYPDIDFTKFQNEYNLSTPSKQDTMEIDLSKQILTSRTIKVEPFSYLREYAKRMQEYIDGQTDYLPTVRYFPKFSHFAINLPTFEMPTEENAKGQELPWLRENPNYLERLGLKVAEGKSLTEATSKDFILAVPENLFANGNKAPIVLPHFPENRTYQIAADENGKIIATGDEASRILDERKKADSRNIAEQISASFRERIKILDAFICLSELKNKEKTEQLSLVEQQKRNDALNYLCSTENLESKMLNLRQSRAYSNDTPYVEQSKRQKELSYANMPVLQSEMIADDMAFLQQSDFYKKFANNQETPKAPEKLVKFMEDVASWKVGEKTSDLLLTIVPPLYSVLEIRQQNLDDSKKIYSESSQIEEDLLNNMEDARYNQDMSEEDKLKILSLELLLTTKQVQSNTSLLDFSFYYTLGVKDDSLLYIKEKNPYYEKMRDIFNMPETTGNPEQLYQNLSARFVESDLIKTDEHEKTLIRNYGSYDTDRTKLDELRQSFAFSNKCILDANMPKLQAYWVHGIYKLAEYETARFLNNPENPKIDTLKLLKAYPRYAPNEKDLSSGSSDFQDFLASYILEKSDFKDKGFYEQKEIYDLMVHKNLFNKEKETKALFAEELKKSYKKLPEDEKEKAALSMLQDKSFTFTDYVPQLGRYFDISEKESVISSVDIFSIKQYFTKEYAHKFVERVGKEPIEGDMLATEKIVAKEDIVKYHTEIKDFLVNTSKTTQKSGVLEDLFTLVADGIEFQPKLTETFEEKVNHHDNPNDLSSSNEIKMHGLNGFNELLTLSPNANLDMITFFTEPYSDDGVKKLRDNISHSSVSDLTKIMDRCNEPTDGIETEVKSKVSKFSKEDLHNMYDEFWSLKIDERAVIMQRFLNNATQDNNSKAIDICLDKYIDKENPYYHICKEVLNTLYKDGTRGKFYTHDKARFMIGAMLSADKPTENDNSKMNVGDALARFCSSNGPAWVKFGQALSNLPMLPADIREPLSVLKDTAVLKSRWELLAEIRENMSPDARANIKKFGKMLGAGSFWETVSVEMNDGSKQVLQMMAPQAKRNADSEFAKIVRTIEDLSSQDTQYAVLDRIVKRAKESAEVETNIPKGYDQYVAAKKNYETFDKIEVNGVKFEMKLMPWTDFNQDPISGNGYKMMEMASGKGLAKLDCSPEEKKILAAGYVVTELGILLGGKSWDIDRHGGQQNFDIQRSKDGKIEKVVVGIYDTGALRPAPSEEEKTMIANFYAAVIKASIKGDNITEVMFNEVKKLEDKGMNATYVSDVQRGCIAINDLVEYQKAGVDKDGKPIEAQSFEQKDFIKLFGAVLSSGAIDRQISDTMLEKLVTDKSVYVALAKETVRTSMKKVREVFTSQQKNNNESLDIVLQARGCVQTKEHNKAIDDAHPLQSEENIFAKTEHTPSNKKGTTRKIVRNAQAFMLKKQRAKNLSS